MSNDAWCVHHWLIPAAGMGPVEGRCARCGVTRTFNRDDGVKQLWRREPISPRRKSKTQRAADLP